MEAVMIPAKTVVHINGIPVFLAVDTLVEAAYENMRFLTGHHYAHLTEAPDTLFLDSPGNSAQTAE